MPTPVPPQNPQMGPSNNKDKGPRFNFSWLFMLIIVGVSIILWNTNETAASYDKEVSYSQFKTYVVNGYGNAIEVNKTDGIASLYISGNHIRNVFRNGTDKIGNRPTVSARYPSIERVETFLTESNYKGSVKYVESGHFWLNLLGNLLPFLILVGIWIYLFRGHAGGGGGIFSVGQSKAKLFEKGKEGTPNVTFKDVAGQEGAKQEVQEIVDFLKNPKKYTDLGGKIPKGALLVGPPGTGKTLLAKAVAGEADVPFFSMSGSDFVEMFVGVGASRVRDLFQKAKAKAPCIVFIDEIDAVGRARTNHAMGGNDERENTLNQLLTEMDGFGTNSGVIVLAATNRVDVLDSALLRAGRFDRQIHVDLPDLSERIAIFGVHLKPIKLEEGLDIEFLARQTPGFSGADIANVCNEAALIAARNNRPAVGKQDFLSAVDRIIGGLEKKTKVMTEAEKHSIALHEAGHASVSWLLEYANPLVKVTIVPRGQALGAAWYLPEERNITTREQMLDEICATLGGRAAEELFTGHISSGALNDLETVTKRAYGMVAYLGMSDALPNLCYYNQNDGYNFQKPYSDATAERIDAEVHKLIAEQYARAKHILSEHKAEHNALADLLQSEEVIFAADVERIFGARPWKSRQDTLMQEEKERIERLAAERGREIEEISEQPAQVEQTEQQEQ